MQVLSPILIIYHAARGHAGKAVQSPPNGAPNFTGNNSGQNTSFRNSIQLRHFGPGGIAHLQPGQSLSTDIESVNSHFSYDGRHGSEPDGGDMVKPPVL